MLLSGGLASIVAWGVALAATWMLRRGSGNPLLAAAFAGGVIALFGGFGDLSTLFRSQVPFAASAVWARLAVAATLGLGAGIVIASALARRAAGGRPAEAWPEQEHRLNL